MTTTTAPESTTHAPARPQAGRLDMYTMIHKALRHCMADALVRLGSADLDDDGQRERVLDRLDAMLMLMRSHLEHENDFLHAAIEARRPGGARRFAEDHLQHRDTIGNLEDESQALRHARPAVRQAAGARLYRHVALFVADNLEHMHGEESENNAALWALYDDAELASIHDRLIASIPPAEMAQAVGWMCGALSVPELTGLLSGMRAGAPREAFEGLLGLARQHLDDTRWAALARALGEPPVRGLVTV